MAMATLKMSINCFIQGKVLILPLGESVGRRLLVDSQRGSI